MADDGKSGTNLASSGVVVAALVATGAYFFHREAPLLDSRPAIMEASIEQLTHAKEQTINARLWQDPLSAVAKALDKSDQRKLDKQCQQNPKSDRHCEPPLVGEYAETLVLGVTVSGAPYPEDDEQRRRARYSVLAGLDRAGFVPTDARHIDYFLWQQANEDAEPSVALVPSSSKLPVLQSYQEHRHSSTSVPLVPYEWFQLRSLVNENLDRNGQKDILVLWLNEADLKGNPLERLSALIHLIRGHRGQRCVPEDGKNFRIIGPFSSDLLHDMVNEARTFEPSCHDYESHWPQLKDVEFYAYGASAPDGELQGISTKTYPTIEQYFKSLRINLHRMVASDDTLAGGIVKELNGRIDPKDRMKFGPDVAKHIALISEWDTFYGQTLPQAVERTFIADGLGPDRIHRFSYLRGLDGLLPTAEGTEKRKQDKEENPAENPAGALDFFKLETDTKSLERPIGQGQFDYLRRISEHLHQIDDKLRKQLGKLKAIGVLGSDVFDKLLILRALRPEFPEALFFTTDFDEDYTIKSELPYTRNLIISSSFGPNLSDKLQGDTPFFRDTYQTSAFLSTLLAIGDPANNWKTSENFSDSVAEQLKAPRIFEIERSGDVLPFAWDGPPNPAFPPQRDDKEQDEKVAGTNPDKVGRSVGKVQNTREWPCWRGEDLINCGYVQPVNLEEQDKLDDPNSPKIMDTLFPTFEESSRYKLARGFVIGAAFALSLLGFRNVRKNVAFEMVLVSFGLGVVALTCYSWEQVAQYLTEQGKGEPIAILEGVSIWPTVLLRGFGIILSVCFIWRVMRGLHKNLEEIASEMKLKPEPVSLWKEFKGILEDIISAWKKFTGLFKSFRGNNPATQSLPLNAEASWKVYIGHERLWPRCIRAALYTVGMFLMGTHVLVPIFGMPVNPARGVQAFNWYILTTLGDVLLMQFLTFFVFDATLFCLLFVNDLRRVQTLWPTETTEIYNGRLRLQTKLVHDWIDLDFVAKRTNCIGSLIYFPFVLIALLIVSRSTVFANYAPSLTILIMQGLSLSVVFACAIMLCWAAKAVRDTTKKNLTDGIIRAKDSDGDGRFAEQLESLLSRVELLKDGAFGPFTQQPLIRAVLLPLGSFGWTALIEKGMLPGL